MVSKLRYGVPCRPQQIIALNFFEYARVVSLTSGRYCGMIHMLIVELQHSTRYFQWDHYAYCSATRN